MKQNLMIIFFFLLLPGISYAAELDCDSLHLGVRNDLSAVERAYQAYKDNSYRLADSVVSLFRGANYETISERIRSLRSSCSEVQRRTIEREADFLLAWFERFELNQEVSKLRFEIDEIANQTVQTTDTKAIVRKIESDSVE